MMMKMHKPPPRGFLKNLDDLIVDTKGTPKRHGSTQHGDGRTDGQSE